MERAQRWRVSAAGAAAAALAVAAARGLGSAHRLWRAAEQEAPGAGGAHTLRDNTGAGTGAGKRADEKVDEGDKGVGNGVDEGAEKAGKDAGSRSRQASAPSQDTPRRSGDAGPAAPEWRRSLPRRVQVLRLEAENPGGPNLPRRTWIVENGPEWDGGDDEVILLPGREGPGRGGPRM